MPSEDLKDRLNRIYAAVDAAVESNISELRPCVVHPAKGVGFIQDFSNGQSPAELENLAFCLVHNIANFQDHFKRWLRANNLQPSLASEAFSASVDLKIIQDLSDRDKHGGDKRDGGHSGKSPCLEDVGRVLQFRVGSGRAGALAVVTGEILGRDGRAIGDLHEVATNAIEAWEQAVDTIN